MADDLNQIFCAEQLTFTAVQTNNNSGGTCVIADDGELWELIVNITSGTMATPAEFDVIVNADTEVDHVFTLPVIAANNPGVAPRHKVVKVAKGDRVEVQSGGTSGGTVLARALLVFKRT